SNGNDLVSGTTDPGFNIVAYAGRADAITITADGRNSDNSKGAGDGTSSGALGQSEQDQITDTVAGFVGGSGDDTITPGSASTSVADTAVWPMGGNDKVTFDGAGTDVLAYNKILAPDGWLTCPSFDSCTFDGVKDPLIPGDFG